MNRLKRLLSRGEEGFHMVEVLVAVLIGGFILVACLQSCAAMMRAANTNEDQIIATNLAQQVIDCARNSSWYHLSVDCLGQPASGPYGAASSSQTLSLYSFPPSSPTPFFPRPLLCNEDSSSGMSYNPLSQDRKFNGSVTETLTMIPASGNEKDNQVEVDVVVTWKDGMGPHTYKTSTLIDQYGVHSY